MGSSLSEVRKSGAGGVLLVLGIDLRGLNRLSWEEISERERMGIGKESENNGAGWQMRANQ